MSRMVDIDIGELNSKDVVRLADDVVAISDNAYDSAVKEFERKNNGGKKIRIFPQENVRMLFQEERDYDWFRGNGLEDGEEAPFDIVARRLERDVGCGLDYGMKG